MGLALVRHNVEVVRMNASDIGSLQLMYSTHVLRAIRYEGVDRRIDVGELDLLITVSHDVLHVGARAPPRVSKKARTKK